MVVYHGLGGTFLAPKPPTSRIPTRAAGSGSLEAEITLPCGDLPPSCMQSSFSWSFWCRCPHFLRLAPEGWKRDHPPQPSLRIGPPDQPQPELSVSVKQSRAAWARLIKKVYEADPLTCSRCHKPMKVIAVITDSAQVLKILRHLLKIGKPPPGLDPGSLN